MGALRLKRQRLLSAKLLATWRCVLKTFQALFCFAFLSVAACETSDSAGFRTRNGVKVIPVNADVFEVNARPDGVQSDFWCGAGNYASRVLGAPDSAPVYVVGGAGRGTMSNSPDAAQFSLKPPGQAQGATGRQGSWGPGVGAARAVGSARRSCREIESDN